MGPPPCCCVAGGAVAGAEEPATEADGLADGVADGEFAARVCVLDVEGDADGSDARIGGAAPRGGT